MRSTFALTSVGASILGLAAAAAVASSGGHDHAAEPAKPPAAVVVPRKTPAADPHKQADPHESAEAAKPAAPADEAGHAPGPPAAAGSVSAAEAVRRLADGNDRFASRSLRRPNQDQARQCDTFAGGEHPFAAVLSCADSRVPPELVFDAGIGDLFVVRVAGNVADVDEVGTLEYGVERLGITAILVLGHLRCDAVSAVVDRAPLSANVEKLTRPIVPAVEQARSAFPQLSGARLIDKAVRQNVRQSIADLSAKSDLLRDRIKSGKLAVVGGVYNLHTSEVDWLEQAAPATATAAAAAGTAAEPKAPAAAKPAGKPAAKPAAAAHGKAPAAGDGHGHDGAAPAADEHAVDDHAVDEHGAKAGAALKSGGHGEPADPHADGPAGGHQSNGVLAMPKTHDATAAAHPKPPDAPADPGKKENLVALGGLLGGGAIVSYGIIHFLKRR